MKRAAILHLPAPHPAQRRDPSLFRPPIVNRACVYPVGGGLDDCEWSNGVRHPTYLWYLYLPLVLRGG